jgi:DNA modification methylase
MQIELRPIDSVRPYEQNPRVNDPAVDAVASSIRQFGIRQPLVVDEQGIIIVGHTRYKAARVLGVEQVPVHVAKDLTPEQVKAYRLADNKTGELSEWDYDLLPIELAELRNLDYDLATLGFNEEELGKLLGPGVETGQGDPDEVPEPLPQAITRSGDMWLLGEHRLLCGDSTRPEDVARLMEGEKATMLWTDPPWNVAIGGDGNPRHRQRPGLANDNLPPEQFEDFLTKFAANAANYVTGDVYCVLGASEWPTLDRALRSCGFHWSATVIWVKDVFVLGRSKFHRRYEPVWYGWHQDGKSSFQGRRDVDDVWEIARPKRSEEHPTMKPCQLVERALEYSSAPGDVVLDLFGGSGTTLIACEKLSRKARLLELEPHYCDVIARRWCEFTGRRAVRVTADGERIEHAFGTTKVAA